MTTITNHLDYLIGFPCKLQDTLTLETGEEIHLWGQDYDAYNNHQTVGVILQSPDTLYGPDHPTPPNRLRLRDPGRLVMPIKQNKEYIFEGAIKEGILPPGTLVAVKPHWKSLAKNMGSGDPILDDQYPDFLYAMIQPTAVMGYANESTGGHWKGYGGYVMCKNYEDPTLPDTFLDLPDGQKAKTIIREIIGGGTSFESGHEWKEGTKIMVAPWMGVPARLNMGMDKKKTKGWDVTFVVSDSILAEVIKKGSMKYEVKPFGMRVFVKPDDPDEYYNRELQIVGSSDVKPNRGTVIASGPGYKDEPTQCKKKMHIIYGPHTGEMVDINGEKMLMMWDHDVWGELKAIKEA